MFNRRKRALTLTDDGTLFRQRAEEIVELADRASREFLERDSIAGVIALGATEAMGNSNGAAGFPVSPDSSEAGKCA